MRHQQHEEAIDSLQKELIEKIKKQHAHLSLSRSAGASNTVREDAYRHQGHALDISSMDRILEVDAENQVVKVEPRVTMEQLVAATLPHGLVPPVVPEFRGITVGGAINGAALESTSHRYGQFNDCCLSYEVLLGDGAIIRVTPDEYSDLFYGISGAYGTLGIILSAEIRLIPTEQQMLLTYRRFSSSEEAITFMSEMTASESPPEGIECLVFNRSQAMVVTADPIRKPPASMPRFNMSWSNSPWYYQHVKKRSRGKIKQDVIATEEYLFRHDRGAFWMGAYALHPRLLLLYCIEHLFGIVPDSIGKLLFPKDKSSFAKLKYPGLLFRTFAGKIMGSKTLYAIMHKGDEKWFADNFCIQDYYLPAEKTAEFCNYVLGTYGITPLWLCPMKPTKKPQILSPHYHERASLLFDVGIYGMPKEMLQGSHTVRDLDLLCYRMGGRKMLYSYTYFNEEEFWKYYDRDAYQILRERYFADSIFHDVVSKVLEQ